MAEIVIQPLAEEDLMAIWRYSFEEWGESQADKYLDGINAVLFAAA